MADCYLISGFREFFESITKDYLSFGLLILNTSAARAAPPKQPTRYTQIIPASKFQNTYTYSQLLPFLW
jgi:hypothetical protein